MELNPIKIDEIGLVDVISFKWRLDKEIQSHVSFTQRSFTMFMPLKDQHWNLLLASSHHIYDYVHCKYWDWNKMFVLQFLVMYLSEL